MLLRADFERREVVRPDDHIWTPSPAPGVERMMLDRVGEEVARATSLVRYEAGSEFPEHVHAGGEEILVLEGQFGDEHGLYPAGSYLRNPAGTKHRPRVGPEGALIFVKLKQFDASDQRQLVLETAAAEWRAGLVPGLSVLPLHEHILEHVALVRWAPQTTFQPHRHVGGEEILVLEGTFWDEHGSYPQGTWLRSPHMSVHNPFTRDDGALIYVKTGHLAPQAS